MAIQQLSVEVGQRIGRGVVIETGIRVTRGKTERAGARLRCDCGNEYEAWLIALTEYQGKIGTLSCGCLYRDTRRTAALGHKGGSPLGSRGLNVEAGQRIGRGVVIDPEVRLPLTNAQRRGGYVHGSRGALLQCDCGNTYSARLISLVERNGRITTTSCGCARREHLSRVRKGGSRPGHARSHGLSGHPLYMLWRQMLRRCEEPKAHNYARYGGRGIKVCPAWHDVIVFIADIERIIGPRPEGRTLDRINPNRDYGPTNVKWSTDVEQAQNKEDSVRTFACTGCAFELKVVGWLAWWLCPACATQNGDDPILQKVS